MTNIFSRYHHFTDFSKGTLKGRVFESSSAFLSTKCKRTHTRLIEMAYYCFMLDTLVTFNQSSLIYKARI